MHRQQQGRDHMHNTGPDQISSELEKRIEAVEKLGDEELGRFTTLDWLFCVAGAVVIPALLIWWFAP